ncbi:hypothetical protein ACLMJK_004487 [Lecanora helva]
MPASTSAPPMPMTAAMLLLDLPAGIFCGIDLLSFTSSAQFCGIRDIPPGWHFIFTSETSSLSIRDGFWFHIPEKSNSSPPLIVRRWDTSLGLLQSCPDTESYKDQAHELWEKNLFPYRQSAAQEKAHGTEDWAGLTQHITPRLLSYLTKSEEWRITSASSAKEDRDEIPGLNDEEVGEEKELGSLGIDLKRTWRDGAVGRERTEGALDSSWALSDVLERWQTKFSEADQGLDQGDAVLGQMEACFLMILTVANYSCLEEWKRCVGLVLTCKRAVRQSEDWFAAFLTLLKKQLERCEDVEGGLFDMSDEGGGQLQKWLKSFKMTLGQVYGEDEGFKVRKGLEDLEEFLKSKYGWELGDEFVRTGLLELEDGEQVYAEMNEMEGEDERGEYAPVVVDLDNA